MSSLATFAPVLDAVRGIGWPALHRVSSAVPGPHISRVRGTTAEFVEHRPYRQGDEPKKIDWKLVARTDRVYIRLSQDPPHDAAARRQWLDGVPRARER